MIDRQYSSTRTFMVCVASALTGLAGASPLHAAEPTKAQIKFFEADVRPLLVEKCYSCHSAAKDKFRGGLALDSRQAHLDGGDTDAAIVPGKPDQSLLIKAVSYADADLQMPPKERLSDAQVATLTKWVALGAPWPETNTDVAAGDRRRPGVITADDRAWWAFQPVTKATPPTAGDGWARNEIDRFIAARHTQTGLTPAPEADKAKLIRRLYFDVWGLPPSPDDVAAFLADTAPDAYERLVDRLLASPRYGERWARHWLDLVRYADSDGYRQDAYRPDAWRYRDYVIRAFNLDKPYDRFVREQLAGDELYPDDPDAITATGYLRHWIYEYNQRDVRTQWDLILTDVTDTTADVFLGLGLQCARCHDHKFDPLLQKDYFRLQAFLGNILPRNDVPATTPEEQQKYNAKLAAWETKTADIRAEIDAILAPYRKRAADSAIGKFPPDIEAMIKKPAAERTPFEHQLAELSLRQLDTEYDRIDAKLKGEVKDKLVALRHDLAEFESLKPAPLPTVMTVTDVGPDASPTTIPKRPDEPIEPGIVTILDPDPLPIAPVPTAPNSTGRRAALAHWLTNPDNPLTARVMVNRVWQYHFGTGLAANASDFGRLGEKPSHPELLDWLAAEFVENGWSLKHLHRTILTSATYRQSAEHPSPRTGLRVDPLNRLLWRGTVRRLEAEQIRDAVLAASGELDPKAGGPGVTENVPRRTIFTRFMRNTRDPLLDVFDAPFWFNSAASRDTTTTPIQSLFLVNGPFLLKRAKAFAARIAKDEPSDAEARVIRAYRLAFGRPPTSAETDAALRFVADQQKRLDPEKSKLDETDFVAGTIPTRDGQAADVKLGRGRAGFQVPDHDRLPTSDFTIEAVIYPRSVASTGAVRTVAAKWSGKSADPGWGFGITGKGSRRKPQTLVIQLHGRKSDGRFGEAALFSDHHLKLNTPYYVAASVTFADKTAPGEVVFFVKDLSNDDEPLLSATIPHTVVGGVDNDLPLTLGDRAVQVSTFDGLIDDVRLSNAALGADELLHTTDTRSESTVGFWQFEAKSGMFQNSAADVLHIRPATSGPVGTVSAEMAAWVDFCHVLLNSSEFLYVE